MSNTSIIAFSGLDGAGKSTQIAQLEQLFVAQGQPYRVVWTRGGYTPLFSALKRGLRRLSGKRLVPASGQSEQRTAAFQQPWKRKLWLTLAIVDLLFVFGVQLRWWRARGQVVICDRYLWDTQIDFALNFPEEQVSSWLLWKLAKQLAIKPDAALVLLISVAESQRRSAMKNEPFPDSAETLAARLDQYETLAESHALTIVDGSLPLPQVTTNILTHLSPWLPAGQTAVSYDYAD